MTFLINQPVRSKRLGLEYIVIGHEPDTLDGQEVVMLRCHDTGAVFPYLVSELVESL